MLNKQPIFFAYYVDFQTWNTSLRSFESRCIFLLCAKSNDSILNDYNEGF